MVSSIVHLDQVGFIPGRLSSNIMRRAFQIMLVLEASLGKSPSLQHH